MKKERVIQLQEEARRLHREYLLGEQWSMGPRYLRRIQKRRRKASRRAVRALKRFLRHHPARRTLGTFQTLGRYGHRAELRAPVSLPVVGTMIGDWEVVRVTGDTAELRNRSPLHHYEGRFVWPAVLDDRTRPEHHGRPK